MRDDGKTFYAQRERNQDNDWAEYRKSLREVAVYMNPDNKPVLCIVTMLPERCEWIRAELWSMSPEQNEFLLTMANEWYGTTEELFAAARELA